MKLVGVGRDDLGRAGVSALDQLADLGIDRQRGLVRHVVALGLRIAEEGFALLFFVLERAELVGHAPLHDHCPGKLGRLLDIARRARRDLVVAEDDFLGNAPAHHRGEVGEHLVTVVGVVVAFGHRHDHAERAAARDDRRLVDRVRGGLVDADEGVTRLMIGGHPLFLGSHDERLPLGAHDHPVLGELELGHRDEPLAEPRGHQRGLVDEIGEVGARHARRAARERTRLDVGGQRDLLHMDLEDLHPPLDVGQRHGHAAVETARAEERGVEHVGPVGGGDDDDAFVGFEAVHLDQQLVEGLLALVIAVAEAGAAVATDGVNLVDEDDARGRFLGLGEHVADAGCADADEHLDEVRARDGEEGHARLAGDGAGEKGLAGAGRADQQRALGDLAAEPRELAGILEEFDDFLKLLARLIDSGDVGEGHAAFLLRQHPRAAFAEAHRARSRILLHLAEDEEADSEDEEEGQRLEEDEGEQRRLFLGLDLDRDILGDQPVGDVGVGRGDGAERLAVGELAADHRAAAGRGGGDGHAADIALVDLFDEIGVSERLAGGGAAPAVDHLDEQHEPEQHADPDEQRFGPGVGLLVVHLVRPWRAVMSVPLR